MNQYSIFLRALLTWLLFIPIVIINGSLREFLYKPYTGELVAHQISTVIASIAFFTLAYIRLRNHVANVSNKKLYIIGTMWVFLTIGFEILIGKLVSGMSWNKLFHDYDISEGRIWPLFLLVIFFSPLFVKMMVSPNKHQLDSLGKQV